MPPSQDRKNRKSRRKPRSNARHPVFFEGDVDPIAGPQPAIMPELAALEPDFPLEIILGHATPFFETAAATLKRLDPHLQATVHVVLEDRNAGSFLHVRGNARSPKVRRIDDTVALVEMLGLQTAWRDTLESTVAASNLKSPDAVWLLAEQRLYDGHFLSVLLRLRRHMSLERRSLCHARAHGTRVPRSLLESVANVLLDELVMSIETVAAPVRARRPDERVLIKIAAARFFAGVATRCFGAAPGHSTLFEEIDDASTLPYERRDPKGGLVLARHDHPDIELLLHLDAPVHLRDARRLRKVLEMSGASMYVLVVGGMAVGLARPRATYTGATEDLFTLALKGHHHWCVQHNNQRLLEVRAGEPVLWASTVTHSSLRAALHESFSGLEERDVEIIWQYVRAAREQTHGTMLVVHRDAEGEAERLALEGFRVTPRPLDPELMDAVTSIDGAVFLTPDGRCVAIGVIVDGVASGAGDRTRGSRFNSAVRYVNAQRGAAIAIVVSEDGTVDLVHYDAGKQDATTGTGSEKA